MGLSVFLIFSSTCLRIMIARASEQAMQFAALAKELD